jgi:hypothetical protein
MIVCCITQLFPLRKSEDQLICPSSTLWQWNWVLLLVTATQQSIFDDWHIAVKLLSHECNTVATWLQHMCHITATQVPSDCNTGTTWLQHSCHMNATQLPHDCNICATLLQHRRHMTLRQSFYLILFCCSGTTLTAILIRKQRFPVGKAW